MDATVLDETAAIEAARGGDARSFALLVERHQEAAFRTAWLIVRDAGAAEDVAQEAFIRAYRALGGFRAGEPFRPWLLRIVTNLARNELRSRGRRLRLLERASALEPPAATVSEAGFGAGEAAAVTAALERLPLDDRIVIYLRFYLECSEREIATAIGRPAGTVKSRLHRACARLRELIEREYPELREQVHG